MKKRYILTAILAIGATSMQAQTGLYGWGSNSWGALGNGAIFGVVFTPTQIGTATWKMIDAGLGYSVAVKDDGTLWSWGTDADEQLGNGTLTDATTPKQISTAGNWQSLSCGLDHTVCVKTDGTLWGWGNNIEGGLGTGNAADVTTPTQIGGGTADWKFAAAGVHYTLAIKKDGTLWGWGDNNYGELGDGSTSDRYSPVQIGTDNDWKMVAAGAYYTFGIKNNGTLWAWGKNSFGGANETSPVQVGTATDWKIVATNDDSHFAIKTNGTLWAWGDNIAGQLGIGTNTTVTTITQVGSATDWINAAPGTDHTIMQKADFTIWGTGAGAMNGQTAASNVPMQIGTDKWATIASGSVHSFALKQSSTGVDHIFVPTKTVVFPNPAQNYLHVDTAIKDITIYSIQGKVVARSVTNTVNVSLLPAGTYTYSCTLKDGTSTKGMFIKQ